MINSKSLNENDFKQFNINNIDNLKLKLISNQILLQKGFDDLISLNHINIVPKKWQKESAIKTLNDMMGSSILADEVGLGKTIECGLILKELIMRKLVKKFIILVPAPLVEQWIIEMNEKFNINLTKVKSKGWEEEDFLICSLPLAVRSKKISDELKDMFFDLVVVDEAHSLKNSKSKSYKFVYQLQRKNSILMSATPIQNDLEELYNLVNIVKPGLLGSKRDFKETYLENKYKPKNTQELKKLLNNVMIRHKRSNTLVELPRRHSYTIEAELENEEHIFYHKVIDFCKNIYANYCNSEIILNNKKVNLFLLVLLSLLKQNCSSPHSVVKTLKTKMLPKLESKEDIKACEELIAIGEQIIVPTKLIKLKNVLKANHQYLIFSEYKDTLFMIEEYFKSEGISVVTYHGELNGKEKHKRIQGFKNKEYQVFLATEAGGQGLNLQFCHNLINYDLPWNPMRIEQRIGRVHRFGQKNDVHIANIVTKGTLEEYILYVLTSKLSLFERVIGELDTIMSYMSNDSIEVQISQILLGSETSKELEEGLREIGDSVLIARETYEKESQVSKEILDTLGVGVEDD